MSAPNVHNLISTTLACVPGWRNSICDRGGFPPAKLLCGGWHPPCTKCLIMLVFVAWVRKASDAAQQSANGPSILRRTDS